MSTLNSHAESRLVQIDGTPGNCSTATVCYTYNAEGHRVRRSVSGGSNNTDHILDINGNVLSEWNSGGTWGTPGTWGEGYVYLGARQLAHYHNGTTLFVHQDYLGSTRLQTDLSKNVQVSFDYLPFGETTQTGSGNWYQFAGNERDYGLDRTWVSGFVLANPEQTKSRQYSSSLARWMHPDPGAPGGLVFSPLGWEPAGRHAVLLSNPQSWNRYTYVQNNPTTRIDPSGLTDCIDGHIGCNCNLDQSGCFGFGLYTGLNYGPGNPANGCICFPVDKPANDGPVTYPNGLPPGAI